MADNLIFNHGNNASNLGSVINGKVYFLHNGSSNIGYLYGDFDNTRYFFGTGDRTNFTDVNIANKIWFNDTNYYINSSGYANLSNINANQINGNLIGASKLAITNAISNIVPNGNKTLNLGASAYRWNYLYVNHIASSNLVTSTVGSNLIPSAANSTYTIGNAARYWASAYINTIYSQVNTIFDINSNYYINNTGYANLYTIQGTKADIANINSNSITTNVMSITTLGSSNATIGNLSVNSILTSLIPLNANTNINLGNVNYKWNYAYLNNSNIYNNLSFAGNSNNNYYINANGSGQLNTMTITNITGTNVTANAGNITSLNSSNATINNLTVTTNSNLNALSASTAIINSASITTLGVNHITTNYLTVNTQVLSALIPNDNSTLNLGGSAARWNVIYGNIVDISSYLHTGTYINAGSYVNAGTQLQVGGTNYFFNSNGYINTLTTFGNYANFAYANIRTNLYINGTTYFINATGYANLLTVYANTLNGTYLRITNGNAFFTNSHIYQTKNAAGTFYYTNYYDGTLTSATMFLANVNTTSNQVLLALGTNIANTNTTAPGFRGALRLYGNSTSYMTLYAPNVGSASNIFLPNIGGELMVHSIGAATGNTNRPVYIAANGSPVVVSNFVNTTGLVSVNLVNTNYVNIRTNLYLNGTTYFINAVGYAKLLTLNATYLRITQGNAFFTNSHIYQTQNTEGTFYYANYDDGTLTSATMFLANVNATNNRVLLALGTSIANTNTTAPGFRGALRLYGNSTSYMTLYAPDVGSGNDIFLPNIGGELMVHSIGAATGNTNRPVYIAANGSPVVVSNFVNTTGLVSVNLVNTNYVNTSYLYVGTNVNSALIPNLNGSYNLGSSTYKWSYIYGYSIRANYFVVNGVNNTYDIQVNTEGAGYSFRHCAYLGQNGDGTNSVQGISWIELGNNIATSTSTTAGVNNMRGLIRIYGTGSYYSALYSTVGGSNKIQYLPNVAGYLVTNNQSINPATNASFSLGNSTYRWANIYGQNVFAYNRLYGVYLTTSSSTYGSAPPAGTWTGQIHFTQLS